MANYINNQTFHAKKITVPINSPVNIVGTTDSSATSTLLAENCYSLTLCNEGNSNIYLDFFPYGTNPLTIDTNTCFVLSVGVSITFNLGVVSERVGYQNPFFMSTTAPGTLRSIQMIMNRR
jgi:hypothetical protein|tara:strand:+ start:194 stop:556 length:363 start_codon:yes stop_codon:yes gene_type:complete